FGDVREERQPIHHGHVDVGQNDVRLRVGPQPFERLQAIVGKAKFQLFLPNGPAEFLSNEQLQIRLVIYYKNLDRGHQLLLRTTTHKERKEPQQKKNLCAPL